jgi:hypothetical protein
LLDRLLPEGVDGIIAVLKDNCGNVMSFELSSGKAYFLGYEDVHEAEMASYVRTETNIEMYEEILDGLCAHDLSLYPTNKLRATYDTWDAAVYTAIVAGAFSLTAFLLTVYDYMVTRRQDKTMQTALHSRAIVTSLFPESIARQLVNEAHETKKDKNMQKPYLNRTGFENVLSDRGEVNTLEVMKASKHGVQCASLIKYLCYLKQYMLLLMKSPLGFESSRSRRLEIVTLQYVDFLSHVGITPKSWLGLLTNAAKRWSSCSNGLKSSSVRRRQSLGSVLDSIAVLSPPEYSAGIAHVSSSLEM